jgi:hypothetical protein
MGKHHLHLGLATMMACAALAAAPTTAGEAVPVLYGNTPRTPRHRSGLSPAKRLLADQRRRRARA